MDIRRTVLLMVFSFSLLMLWNNWQIHHGNAPLFAPAPVTNKDTGKGDANGATPSAGVPSAPVGSAAVAGSGSAAVANATTPPAALSSGSQTVVVTTDVLKLTFDLQGAQLVRSDLLAFPASDDNSKPTVLLDNTNGHYYVVQSGVYDAPAGLIYPNHLSPFTMISDAKELSGDTLVVKFASESGGVKVTKTYTLKRGQYVINVDHQIENTTSAPVTPSLYLQITHDGVDPNQSSAPSFLSGPANFMGLAVYSDKDKFQKITFQEIEKNKASYAKQADNGWFALVQHYFVTAWIPNEGTNRRYEITEIKEPQKKNLYAIRSMESVGTINPNSSATIKAKLWVGPQDQSELEKVAPGLDLVIDYGLLTIIAKPVFSLMTWLFTILGNWGWTIVALTFLIKAAFYPLSAASYRSMAKMKQVSPRLQALKEKFGDDRQKLNAAMMEMYRTEKINPLGGCLPIVIQIPVFISLYYVLGSSVELRGAPWILWVHDLSLRDPYFILPAIMMATMFLQMKLNPTPPDPMQAKVMMFMPLVFGGMMFFFPAGLVLYWCVNNILSIAQQWYITKSIEKQAAIAHR
ncbi:membrane protein insertase YidC [Orrella sp. NBD-18]|uniref:Membrane protein insertase YidC n=1 Tax=Sheuella amnicola TaxID=2707330 RepID=A0A6B2QVL0_9BURK|nr:membrane protein insertase YidC [Sheuella amnicola]NDY82430.1 membrane protein insertase YidC [Sheuella amnicola]